MDPAAWQSCWTCNLTHTFCFSPLLHGHIFLLSFLCCQCSAQLFEVSETQNVFSSCLLHASICTESRMRQIQDIWTWKFSLIYDLCLQKSLRDQVNTLIRETSVQTDQCNPLKKICTVPAQPIAS